MHTIGLAIAWFLVGGNILLILALPFIGGSDVIRTRKDKRDVLLLLVVYCIVGALWA